MRIATGLIIAMLALAACSKEDAGESQAQTQPQAEAVSSQPPPAQSAAPAPAPAPVTQQVSSAPAPQAPPRTIQGRILTRVNFVCEDNSYFAAQFESGPAQARIIFNKRPELLLRQKHVSEGFWYRAEGYELRGSGQRGFWIEPGKKLACVTYTKYSRAK